MKDYEPIVRLVYKIINPNLLKSYDISQWGSFNGLLKFSCESILYTSKNIFYMKPPMNSNKQVYGYVDLGFLDIKNLIFYETGLLLDIPLDKDVFFKEWVAFLQIIIENKVYMKLFENFGKVRFLKICIKVSTKEYSN